MAKRYVEESGIQSLILRIGALRASLEQLSNDNKTAIEEQLKKFQEEIEKKLLVDVDGDENPETPIADAVQGIIDDLESILEEIGASDGFDDTYIDKILKEIFGYTDDSDKANPIVVPGIKTKLEDLIELVDHLKYTVYETDTEGNIIVNEDGEEVLNLAEKVHEHDASDIILDDEGTTLQDKLEEINKISDGTIEIPVDTSGLEGGKVDDTITLKELAQMVIEIKQQLTWKEY